MDIILALSELKNRFNDVNSMSQIPIESFSSYEGLYKNDLNYKKNALLIISASTSGNILNYITKLHSEISRSNIVVLYFLDIDSRILEIKEKKWSLLLGFLFLLTLCLFLKSHSLENSIDAIIYEAN